MCYIVPEGMENMTDQKQPKQSLKLTLHNETVTWVWKLPGICLVKRWLTHYTSKCKHQGSYYHLECPDHKCSMNVLKTPDCVCSSKWFPMHIVLIVVYLVNHPSGDRVHIVIVSGIDDCIYILNSNPLDYSSNKPDSCPVVRFFVFVTFSNYKLMLRCLFVFNVIM